MEAKLNQLFLKIIDIHKIHVKRIQGHHFLKTEKAMREFPHLVLFATNRSVTCRYLTLFATNRFTIFAAICHQSFHYPPLSASNRSPIGR